MSTLDPAITCVLRERAERVRGAFANYIDGTGHDAHEIATALPAILDELESLRAKMSVPEGS